MDVDSENEVVCINDEDLDSSDFELSVNEISMLDEEIHNVEDSSEEHLILSEEDDLLDLVDEKKALPTVASRKLNAYVTSKIIRKAKNPRKKNYFFIKGLGNALKQSPIKLKINIPSSENKNDKEKNVSESPKNTPQNLNEKSENFKTSSLQIKSSMTLNKMHENASLKIDKVFTPGDLSIQKLKLLETQIERPKELSLIIKKKIFSADKKDEKLPSEVASVSKESVATSRNQHVTEKSLPASQLLSPVSFPKAIVYPDIKKTNAPIPKPAPPNTMSYNEVFTKATAEKIKSQEAIHKLKENHRASKEESTNKANIKTVPDSEIETQQKEVLIEENEPQPFKYLIPQDLLASKRNEGSSNSESKSRKNESSIPEISSTNRNSDDKDSVLMERPKINYELIDALADYRVIARYLFNRLNIPPMDFDATDDYFNLYKLSRN